MSDKKLLEEATIKKFMKLANIDKPLRESFVETLDEKKGKKGSKSKTHKGEDYEARKGTKSKTRKGKKDYEARKGSKSKTHKGKKDYRGARKESLDEDMDTLDLFEEDWKSTYEEQEDVDIEDLGIEEPEEEVEVDIEDIDIEEPEEEVEEEGEMEVDISEDDARALLRVADALAAALGVEREEEEPEPEEEEEIEIEEPEEEEEIEIEEPEEEEEVEETEEIMQEALVKKIAARVAARLLKK
jgi:hypothetical protein